MVRWPAAARGRRLRARAPRRSASACTSTSASGCYRDGEWVTVYEVVAARRPGRACEPRCGASSSSFRRLTGRDPTHLDSHQHVHNWRARDGDLPRHRATSWAFRCATTPEGIRYCGDFYGQTAEGDADPGGDHAPSALIEIIRALPPGVTELGCHPGHRRRHRIRVRRASASRRSRSCATRACARRSSGEGVELRSFADIDVPRLGASPDR